MKLHFEDQAFSFELLRAVSYMDYKGAEIGECLATANKIKEGDFDSWFIEWRRTAERVEKIGERCLEQGHIISGREALLRASNYYRTAEFFLEGKDSRRDENYRKSVTAFKRAMKNMDIHVEEVKIPYEDAYMAGYFFRANAYKENNKSYPTIVFIGGYDSTAEEAYYVYAAAAINRGYNCLVFDSPGIGEMLRIQNKPSRYDYEVPVGAAIDFVEKRNDVDKEKISLIGMSMGGYYAPRAAAFEKRVKACVAYDVFYDLWEATKTKNPQLAQLDLVPKEKMEALMEMASTINSNVRWLIQNAMWVFGLENKSQIPEFLKQYTLKEVAGQIECPVLILAGEKDHFVPLEQVDDFYDKLTCEKTVRIFTTEEGAEEHCQVGNLSLFHQVTFDWLDDIFKK